MTPQDYADFLRDFNWYAINDEELSALIEEDIACLDSARQLGKLHENLYLLSEAYAYSYTPLESERAAMAWAGAYLWIHGSPQLAQNLHKFVIRENNSLLDRHAGDVDWDLIDDVLKRAKREAA